jgi:hypothetical protein
MASSKTWAWWSRWWTTSTHNVKSNCASANEVYPAGVQIQQRWPASRIRACANMACGRSTPQPVQPVLFAKNADVIARAAAQFQDAGNPQPAAATTLP